MSTPDLEPTSTTTLTSEQKMFEATVENFGGYIVAVITAFKDKEFSDKPKEFSGKRGETAQAASDMLELQKRIVEEAGENAHNAQFVLDITNFSPLVSSIRINDPIFAQLRNILFSISQEHIAGNWDNFFVENLFSVIGAMFSHKLPKHKTVDEARAAALKRIEEAKAAALARIEKLKK